MPIIVEQFLQTTGNILGRARFCQAGLTVLLLVLLQHPGEAFSTPAPTPYNLTFGWDPSPDPDVVGYHLYYGTTSGVYTNSFFLPGNVTTATVSNLVSGVTYYFAVTDYDAAGQESAYSGELNYIQQLPGAQLQIQGAPGGQLTLTVAGPSGHTYAIEATTDFAAWTSIGTVTLNGSGPLNFTDTAAANFPQRFYRTRDLQP